MILLCLLLLLILPLATSASELPLNSGFHAQYTQVAKHASSTEVSTSASVQNVVWSRLGFTRTYIPALIDVPVYGAELGVNTIRQNNWAGGTNWRFWGRQDAFMALRIRGNINWQSNTWYARISPVVRTYTFKQDELVRNDFLLQTHIQKPFADVFTVDLAWEGVLGGDDYVVLNDSRDYRIAQSYEAFRLHSGMDKNRILVAARLQSQRVEYGIKYARINTLVVAPAITQLEGSARLKFSGKMDLLFGFGQMLDGEQASHDYLTLGFEAGY